MNDLRTMLFSSAIQLPGWIYLFCRDWRMALALAAVLWGNNLDLAHRIPRISRSLP